MMINAETQRRRNFSFLIAVSVVKIEQHMRFFQGGFPPSIQSRVNNIVQLSKQLSSRAPITSIAVETVYFDMQKLENPEVFQKLST